MYTMFTGLFCNDSQGMSSALNVSTEIMLGYAPESNKKFTSLLFKVRYAFHVSVLLLASKQ